MFARIAIDIPIDKTFHYRIPKGLKNVVPGSRVWVTFGNRRLVGYVVEVSRTCPVSKVKPVDELIDEEPILGVEELGFTKWMSEYYYSSWGSALNAAIPWPLKKGKTRIRQRGRSDEADYERSVEFSLTAEQKKAVGLITKASEGGRTEAFLLHGITSSGKTEVYLQSIRNVLSKGMGAVVLIPEISLTPQAIERFKSRFGEEVALVHSQMRGSARFREWERIKKGEAKVVVGARSALFSPVKSLGLIVVDEEHETSYKQEDNPRYHAARAALERARIAGCPVVLGSATPSLESFQAAREGDFRLLSLSKRIDDRPLAKATVVDMKKEITKGRQASILSTYLRKRIEETVENNNQVMLFLNRRGFSTYIYCRECGCAIKCKKCDSVMVYHSSKRELVCHYCSRKEKKPDICPECRSSYLKFSGKGTEKIESEIARLFPRYGVERMDTDSTRKRGSHDRILKKLKDGSTKILVGTQMIAKGHDFPNVTLVGVISADTGLNLPDFRAGERTFNLITQVAGRAGRGETAGEIIIQTFVPENYAIQAAASQDYEAFYSKEMKTRRELKLPPFCHLIKLTLKAAKEKASRESAGELRGLLAGRLPKKGVQIIGPAPGPVSRIRNRYIYNLIIKTDDVMKVTNHLKELLGGKPRFAKASLTVDVDPISL